MSRKSWQWQPGHFLKKARKSLFDSKGTPLSQRSPILDSSKEEKKESMVSKKPNALHCLKTLEDYRKDAKLKSTPGLVFKDIPVFRPIEPKKIIDEEIEDIAALAERLHILRLTIAQDSASLGSSLKLFHEISSENKSMSGSTEQRRGSKVVLGEDWSCLDGEARVELNLVLQRLKQEERETILGILQAFENELTQRRRQAKNRWLQVKMAVKMGSFRTSKREATPEVESKEETQTTLQAIDVRSTVKPLNLRQCYEAALLAEDQRLGWAKLTIVDKAPIKTGELKSEEKETKEKKEEDEVALSSGNTSHIAFPGEMAYLRNSLREWLHLDQGLKHVQLRLRAIRDYCLLVNRLTECIVHLEHDTQLVRQILVQFKREPLKGHPALVAAVCQLAAAQDPVVIKNLLNILLTSLKEASLLEIPLLEGIAIVLHHAKPEQVSLGHLSVLLNILVERSRNLGSDLAEDEVLGLLQAMATVLSSMALISQHRAVQQAVWQKQQLESKVDKIKEQKYESEPPTDFLQRSRQWLQDKQRKALESLEGSQDKSGLAIIQRQDYEKLCQSLNDSIIKVVQSRFDLTVARSQQPELIFALSLIRQALMRLAHKEPTRSEKLLEGAQLFFSLVESAKNAVTDFSIQSLLEAGNKLMEFINATPLGEKLREKTGSEDDRPQPWFEYYLSLKTLIDNDQLLKFEEALIESGQQTISDSDTVSAWNDCLTQSVLQLLERMAQWDSREPVRQGSAQLLILFHHPELWQWPEQTDFTAIKKSSEARLEKMSIQGSTDTHTQRMANQALKASQMESQRLLRKARRECQESDLHFQLHDYCVLQLRQAGQDAAWVKDDSRYVPALAKSSLEAEEDTAELFYPAFHKFLQTRSATELKTVEVKGDNQVSIPNPKTALLIMGDAGTGKSLFVRRHHLIRCRQYFSHQLEDRQQTSPTSFYLMLNQMPVASPLEYYLDQQGFTESHIRELQEKGQLIIHLDGYDEWSSDSQYPWIFATKSFGAWVAPGRNQMIITCRSQYVQGNNQYREAFTSPKKVSTQNYGKELDNSALSEWVITRLDTGGVVRLTQYYVMDEQAQGHQPFTVMDYLQQFQSSDIQELVRTPIILLMALQVLPTLRKRHEGNIKVLRLDIYREFIRQYMVAQRQKKLERGGEVRGLLEAAERYAIQLALAFFAEDKAGISYQPPSLYGFGPSQKNLWDTFFAPNQADTTLSEVVPLRVTTQRNVQEATTITQYSFVHKSMLDYFTALGLYAALSELIGCLTEEFPQPPSLSTFTAKDKEEKYEKQKKPANVEAILPYLAFASVASSNSAESGSHLLNWALQWEALQRYAQEKRRWETDHRKKLLNSPWNTRPINAEQAVIDFIYEILTAEENRWITEQQGLQDSLNEIKERSPKPTVQEEKKIDYLQERSPRMRFKQQMITLMQASKIYPELAQASANAVTVLCRIGMGVFSNLDFSGVRWPGADLVGSYWDRVKFTGADLSRADLRRMWASHCHFQDAVLHQVQFGEYPSFNTEEKIKIITQNPRNPAVIAIGVGKKIVIYDSSQYRVIQELEGKSEISLLQYSPDGTQLASAHKYSEDDYNIYVWNVQQSSLSLRLKGHTSYISSLSYSPDGSQLASGSGDKTIRIWDSQQGKLILVIEGFSNNMCFAHNGKYLAVANSEGRIQLWDIAKNQIIQELQNQYKLEVEFLIFSPDSSQIAYFCYSRLWLWDIGHSKLNHDLGDHDEQNITCLRYSPDGLQLASGGRDKMIRLWDVKQKKLLYELPEPEVINCLCYSPDGSQLASGNLDKGVRLWEVGKGQLSQTLTGCSGSINQVIYTPNGKLIAISDKEIHFFDIQQGKLNNRLVGHMDNSFPCLKASLNGFSLASGGGDGAVLQWNSEDGQLAYSFEGHFKSSERARIHSLEYSSNGMQLACMYDIWDWGSQYTLAAGLWDLVKRKFTSLDVDLGGNCLGDEVGGNMAFSPNGLQLACSCWFEDEESTIYLWNTKPGKLGNTLKGHAGGIACLDYSSDGLQLASGCYSGKLLLWDTQQGALQYTLEIDVYSGGWLSYSPDGLQLASSGKDKTINIWDPHKGQLSYTLEGRYLKYRHDNLQWALVGDDSISLWDVQQKKLAQILKGHTSEIRDIAYSRNGSQLVSSSSDQTIRIWDTQSGNCLQIWHSPNTVSQLVWRANHLFISCLSGIVAALEQDQRGLFILKWLQCGLLPALDFNSSDFSEVKGLNPMQTTLVQQRGGKIKLETSILDDQKEIKELPTSMDSKSIKSSSISASSSTLSASDKLPSAASTSSSLFGRLSVSQDEEKQAKKLTALPSIPAYKGSTFATHTRVEAPPSQPRRYSSPGRLQRS